MIKIKLQNPYFSDLFILHFNFNNNMKLFPINLYHYKNLLKNISIFFIIKKIFKFSQNNFMYNISHFYIFNSCKGELLKRLFKYCNNFLYF